VYQAALKVRARVLQGAADHLEVSPADLALEDGRVAVRGVPGRGLSLREVAALVGARRPGSPAVPSPEPLEATHYHHTTHETTCFAVHVAVVAVDTKTGVVTPRKYAVLTDVGRAIHPAIVEGQLVGGVIHGLGGTLLEELVYGDDGQLLTGSFMDYLLPSAAECPEVAVTILEEAPATSNPLGVKGVGESGTSGAGAALANAVADALGPGVAITRLPLSPKRLLDLLEEGARP
jgi:carbon-monoxide dehydrogenase large subunit/6-hydroxypseudooxynicotine dehydrogenase subunit gamma